MKKLFLTGFLYFMGTTASQANNTAQELDLYHEHEALEFEHGHDHDHEHEPEWEQDGELVFKTQDFSAEGCKKASSSQIAEVNRGNALKEEFLRQCAKETDDSPWCQQLVRPNPSSKSTFRCTYGDKQPHQLIHPSKSTWKHAIKAVELIQDLEKKNLKPCLIYNWWRPAPYNGNVGGAAGRHPYGTSVDVRFCSKSDMERAFKQLCEWRRQGRLRAIGYYGSTGLHFGIGDKTGNTWGKSCR